MTDLYDIERLTRLPRRELRTTLKGKGTLSLPEAALFVGMAPRTLYNRIQRAEKESDPGLAPRRKKNVKGQWEFQVADLEAWEKRLEKQVEAHY